jgi:hypothetical protein
MLTQRRARQEGRRAKLERVSPFETPARPLLVPSEEVGRAAALGLVAGDADVRELAALQLTAGAALDLAMAEKVLGMRPCSRTSSSAPTPQ